MTIYLDAIDKKLTEQGFDTIAVLNKLPEIVAVLSKLAERLEGRHGALELCPNDSLGKQIFAAVEGIKSGDTGVIDDLVAATKNYGTLLASGSVESQQVAEDCLLVALKAYQSANRLNSDGEAELYDLANDAIMKAEGK